MSKAHPSTVELQLLSLLAGRAQAALARDATTQVFLQKQGILDEGIWAAFRVGVCADGLLDGLDEHAKARLKAWQLLPANHLSPLTSGGLLIPSFDPRAPEAPVGLIRVQCVQRRHEFLTPCQGITCAPDIGQATRLVLVDSPMLALRLASMGVQGVAAVEAPEVLSPLREWFQTREIVLAGYRKPSLEAMAKALGLRIGSGTARSVPGRYA